MVKLLTMRMYFRSRNHLRSSSESCLRVQFTASAAAGLNPSKVLSPEQYSSWFPLTQGMFMLRTMSRHSLGLAL